MDLNQKALELKTNLIDSLRTWGHERISAFVKDNPKLIPLKSSLDRFVNNILIREDEWIKGKIDTAMLFIADENGCVDKSLLMDDLMSMLKDMEETSISVGGMDVVVGKGSIKIPIPKNPFTSLFFGDTGAIRITEADFNELKTLFTEDV